MLSSTKLAINEWERTGRLWNTTASCFRSHGQVAHRRDVKISRASDASRAFQSSSGEPPSSDARRSRLPMSTSEHHAKSQKYPRARRTSLSASAVRGSHFVPSSGNDRKIKGCHHVECKPQWRSCQLVSSIGCESIHSKALDALNPPEFILPVFPALQTMRHVFQLIDTSPSPRVPISEASLPLKVRFANQDENLQ